MKLISCHIDHFGKLENLDYCFNDGLNTILQENGWGKTTFSNFLFAMFYGVGGNNSKALLRRDKYAPWNGGNYGGSVRFSANGKNYELFRSFGASERNDQFLLQNADNQSESSDYSSNIGEELFKINGETFLRTAFVRQGKTDFEATSEMNSRISESGGGALGLELFSGALEKLERRERELLSPKSTAGLIRPLMQKIVDDQAELLKIRRETSAFPGVKKSLQEIEDKILEKENEKTELREKVFRLGESEKKNQYNRLLKDEEEAKHDLEKEPLYGKNFIKGICDQVIQKQSAMGRKKEEKAVSETCLSEMKLRKITAEQELTELRNKETLRAEEERRRAGEEKEKKCAKIEKKKRSALIYLILGILCFGIGLWRLFGASDATCIPAFAFSAFLFLLALSVKSKAKKEKEALQNDTALEKEAVPAETPEMKNFQEEIKNRESDMAECREKIDALQEEIEKLEQEVDGYLESYGRKSTPENRLQALTKLQEDGLSLEDKKDDLRKAELKIEQFKSENKEFLAALEAGNLTDRDGDAEIRSSVSDETETAEVLKQKLEENRNTITALTEEKSQKERALDILRQKLDEEKELEEKIDGEQEKVKQYQTEHRLIEKAIEHLKKANETLSNAYQGPIQKGLEEYYEKMNGKKDLRIQVDNDMNVKFVEGAKLMDPEKLNAGHQDLLNLSVRIAVLDAMYKEEKPFLIFDDVFTNLDDERLALGKETLRKISENYQVIYFTCLRERS